MNNSNTGCIFNIQKFSIHDGPGIRTTVFFKGCPLRCKWCANPESICSDQQILWDRAQCVLCGDCVRACPVRTIVVDGEAVRVNHDKCTGCGKCVQVCPKGALSLSGKGYGIEEVLEACLQDRDFYAESGGGVTLSGGEAMMQSAFVLEVLLRLRGLGIHTAMETNGFVQPDIFRRVADAADLLLFDVKHYDAARHKEGTGVDNALIMENLRWAIGYGKEVLVRIPVISGYNDSVADAAGFARALLDIPVEKAQLLPFHQFGQNKYYSLGMEYELGSLRQMRKEDLAGFRRAMLDARMREVIL